MSNSKELVAQLNRDLAKASELVTAGQFDLAVKIIQSVLSLMEENLELGSQIPFVHLSLVRVEALQGHFQIAQAELILYPSLRIAQVKIKVESVRNLPPALIGPFRMKALNLKVESGLSPNVASESKSLRELAPQLAIDTL
jgi:hypothetical protein